MRFTLLANLLSAAGSFGLTIVFSRHLLSTDFATIAVWSSLFSWGQFLVSLSSSGYVVRATVTGGREEGIQSIAIIIHYVVFISALCAIGWFIADGFGDGKLLPYNQLFFFSCMLASLTAIQSAVLGYYRFIEWHRVANISQLIFSMGTLLLTFVVAETGSLVVADRVRIPVAVLLGIFVFYKPGAKAVVRRLRLQPLNDVLFFVKYSMGFVGHSAAHTLVGGLDRLVLHGRVDAVALGNYHVIKQGAESLRIIGQAIQSQMAPAFLKLLHNGELLRTKALASRFMIYVAGGALFSFAASIAMFILSGRGATASILALCLVLVVGNAMYSLFDFKSLPWSLGRGYGLSIRSAMVCSIYAATLYVFASRINLMNMSFAYTLFTAALLLSVKFMSMSKK